MDKIIYFDVQEDEREFLKLHNEGKYDYYLESCSLTGFLQVPDEYKDNKINQLLANIMGKKYNKTNQERVDEIIAKAKVDINNCITLAEIDEVYNNSLEELSKVKTKGCNSNAVAIFFAMASMILIAKTILKKHL